MKQYYPYSPSAPSPIYGEEHVIENGQILLNHIPYLNTIVIDGFRETNSAVLAANQFFCAYGSKYYYREANCVVRFNERHNGETVRVKYQQVGTIITANDMNEIKEHLENSDLHSSFVLPAASTETRGGIRVGRGLNVSDDVLSVDEEISAITPATRDSLGGIMVGSRLSITDEGVLSADTIPTATNIRLGGVVVESDANIARTIERYFPASGETLPVHTQAIATRNSLGVVKIGDGLSITEEGLLTADAQDFTLTPASADSLGGVKVGDGLSIDANGVLSADTVEPYMLPIATADSLGGVKVGSRLSIDTNGVLSADALQTASTSRLGGVVVESDTNIARTIERYFPSVTADTEILPVLSSIPVATADSLGGVKIGERLTITEDGILSADAQGFTLTAATRDSLGGVIVGNSLTITDGVLNYNLPNASTATKGGVVYAADNDIANTIERYFPSVTADTEIIPALTSIPPATRDSIGGVIIGNGLSIDSLGVLSADAQDFTLTPATNDSLGGVKIGARLTITEDGILSADSQSFTLTPATRDSLGGVKIGARLSIDSLGVLSADTVETYTLPAATADSLGGVTFARDADISAIINEYFPTVSADEIISVLTSIPPATRDSIGGVIVGDGLTITEGGILSAEAQNFTLTPATADSLGGVKIGTSLTFVNSVLDYNLPTASTTTKGGVKIGRGLSMSGESLNADAQDFTLTAATFDSLGGVKIESDENVAAMIEEYFPSDMTFTPALTSIPPATTESLGGVIVGDGLSITDGGLLTVDSIAPYTLPAATADSLGGVKIGTSLTFVNGVLDYNLPIASTTTRGGIKIGRGLTMTDGILSADAQDFTLKPATSGQLGGVKVGARLSITADGILSADSITPYTLPAASDEEISSMIEEYFPETLTPEPFTLPAATRTSLGGIIVGDRLTITNSGVLSANEQTYTLPTASASTKGGIKIGKGLTMTGETLSANADNYTLPAATNDSLGGVKIASDTEISEIIERYFPASIEAGTIMGVQFVDDSDVNTMLNNVFPNS